jgi:nucleoid-associated protein YgaU
MGLFSFLKGSGEKVTTKPKAAGKTVLDEAAERADKINALRDKVLAMKLDIKNFDLDINGDTVTVYGEAESQAAKEKAILAVGNTEGIATVDDRISVVVPEPEAQFYEVKSGDSLSKIAKHFYGDAMKYNVIFEANTPMLKDPDKIYPGQMLRIPNQK